MIAKLVTYILFMSVWCLLSGIPTTVVKLLFTIFVPLINLLLSIKFSLVTIKNYFKISSITYLIWLLKEIVVSSISVTKIIWKKNISSQGATVYLKTIQKKDIGIIIYANSITLTPGTVTLYIKNKYLLVHALDPTFISGLKKGVMDKRIKNIIQ